MADMYFDIVYKYVRENNYLYVKNLLDDHGDDIDINNFINDDELQLIHIACANNSLEIVQLLIDKGSDLNNWTQSLLKSKKLIEGTPLEIAFKNNNITIARAIIEAGLKKNKNFITDIDSDVQGALTEAIREYNYSIDVIKLMIEYGANINKSWCNVDVDADELDDIYVLEGWTPLMVACNLMREDIVKVLIEAGSDVNAVSEFGDTAESILLKNKTAYEHILLPEMWQYIVNDYNRYNELSKSTFAIETKDLITYNKNVRDQTKKHKEHFAQCDRIAKMIKDERLRLMKEKRNARRLVILGKRPSDNEGISKIGWGPLGMVASYIDPSGNRPKLKE